MSDERPPPSPKPPRKYPDLHDRMDALAILAEIRMSRIEKQQAEIDRLRQQVTQRGARMQVMRDYLTRYSGPSTTLWRDFCRVCPEAAAWFDEEGVPR